MTYVKKGGQNAAENTVLYTPTVCPMDSDRVSLALSSVLYSAPPIPAGIFRNPQESTGMGPESAGIHRNGTGIHRNETGMGLKLSETRPENQYIYIITCIQIDTTDIIPLPDTFTLICLHTVT